MRRGREVGAAAVAVAVMLAAGCKATPPNAFETRLMTVAKHRVLVGDKKLKNPLAANTETIAAGKEAFGHYCVACHGMDGQNTGVPFVTSPPAPSLASREVQSYTDGQLKWVIENGIWPSGMPGSNGTLSDEEQWSIVLFLRHLPPAGSVGEPEMYTH
ncbi:MAG TPA: c-type cytochrome [Acidobacteriaceae bacterium]|nr:c-type cytochrome [Acidobacteriaceae bacterium]